MIIVILKHIHVTDLYSHSTICKSKFKKQKNYINSQFKDFKIKAVSRITNQLDHHKVHKQQSNLEFLKWCNLHTQKINQ